jgi:hypothetical protein
MFSIANRYALAKEVTLDKSEQKKEPGHLDQPSSSKGYNKNIPFYQCGRTTSSS